MESADSWDAANAQETPNTSSDATDPGGTGATGVATRNDETPTADGGANSNTSTKQRLIFPIQDDNDKEYHVLRKREVVDE